MDILPCKKQSFGGEGEGYLIYKSRNNKNTDSQWQWKSLTTITWVRLTLSLKQKWYRGLHVSWMLCYMVHIHSSVTNASWQPISPTFKDHTGNNWLFHNIANQLPTYTKQHPRWLKASTTRTTEAWNLMKVNIIRHVTLTAFVSMTEVSRWYGPYIITEYNTSKSNWKIK